MHIKLPFKQKGSGTRSGLMSVAMLAHPTDKTKRFYFVADGNCVNVLSTALKKVATLKQGGLVTRLLVSTKYLVVAYTAPLAEGIAVDVGRVRVYDVLDRTKAPLDVALPHGRYAHKNVVTVLAATPQADGSPPILFSGSMDGAVKTWKYDGGSGKWLTRALGEGHVRAVSGMEYVNGRLITCGLDHCIQVWNPAAPASPTAVRAGAGAHGADVSALARLSVAGKQCVVTGSRNGSMVVWDMTVPDNPKEIKREKPFPKKPISCIQCLDIPPGGGGGGGPPGQSLCVVGHTDGGMTVRDVGKGLSIVGMLGKHAKAGLGHSACVTGIAPVHPDGKTRGWLTVGADDFLLAWLG